MTAIAEKGPKQVRLSAVVATAKTAKQRGTEALDHVDRSAGVRGDQSPLTGLSRVNKPVADDGIALPDQKSQVQYTVEDLLKGLIPAAADMMDVVATQEYGNALVRADVKVGETVLIKGAPVGYLLFLERQLVSLHTLVSRLPTLDPSESWDWNEEAGANGAWASQPRDTKSTSKVTKVLQLAPPVISTTAGVANIAAQVTTYTDDVHTSTWTTIKFSGALRGDRKRGLIERVELLQKAVKTAREEANSSRVDEVKVGETILNWLLFPVA